MPHAAAADMHGCRMPYAAAAAACAPAEHATPAAARGPTRAPPAPVLQQIVLGVAQITRYARFFDTAISFDLGFLSFLPITSLNNRAYRAISANRLPILLSTTYHEPMEPTLCHTSALEYWRSVRIGQRSFRAIEDTRPLLDEPPRKGSLAEPRPWWLERPLHVLVPHNSVRRASNEAVSHVEGGTLPPRSTLDSMNGFRVCSPELCFVQMATLWNLPKLIELGFELCGAYDLSDNSYRTCAPLTSVEKLTAYANSLDKTHGKRKAIKALRYVANGSASSRETILTMLLTLPYRMGGYGLKQPLLNHRIDLGRRERRIAGKNYLVCDLYWPEAKLDVEYDGGNHEDPEQMLKDSMRRDALVSMGITVLTVTKWQLENGGSMNAIAHTVAEHTGKRLRYVDPDFTRANRQLRRDLLGF